MDVERRQMIVGLNLALDDLIGLWEIGQQGHQWAVALKDDFARLALALGDITDEAQELKMVAHPLFCVDEQCFAVERRAIPFRLFKGAAARRETAMLPPPFVFGETLAQLIVQQQHQCQVPMKGAVVRPYGDGPAEPARRCRAVETSALKIAEIVVNSTVAGA